MRRHLPRFIHEASFGFVSLRNQAHATTTYAYNAGNGGESCERIADVWRPAQDSAPASVVACGLLGGRGGSVGLLGFLGGNAYRHHIIHAPAGDHHMQPDPTKISRLGSRVVPQMRAGHAKAMIMRKQLAQTTE